MMFPLTAGAFLVAAAISSRAPLGTEAFAVAPAPKTSTGRRGGRGVVLRAEPSPASTRASATGIHRHVSLHDRIALRNPSPEERGKGGVEVVPSSSDGESGGGIGALEVLARIPRDLVVTSADLPVRAAEAAAAARDATWATALTAATLAALHPTEEDLSAGSNSGGKSGDGDNYNAVEVRREWIRSWRAGGWGTDAVDLGPDIADSVIGTLLSTGTDNDHNIYAKFRMPCHPAIFKASFGLEVLTDCTADEAREALTARGFAYRSMRDALQGLVLESTERPEAKGTVRDKRCWDVADALSRVLSRATAIQLEDGDARAVVPVHERLAHSSDENTKLVSLGKEILLVATRDIAAGEPITRDYTSAPRLPNDTSSEGSPLHLLLQFGLPPDAWPAS